MINRYMCQRIGFWVSVLAALLVFGAIYVLTEQSPEQTSGLSSAVQNRVFGATATGGAQHENVIVGDSDTASEWPGGLSNFMAWMLSVAGIRKWAHSFEFFAFGLPVAVASLLWWGRPLLLRRRISICIAVCASGSLFDQTHKLFVPDREFDFGDLFFDLLGCGAAILVVFLTGSLVGPIFGGGRSGQ